VCDVGDRAAVDVLAARIVERHPRVKLLVNNAGVPGKADFVTGDPDRIENVMRINYFGGIWCLRAFLPALEAAAPADVVNVVSVAGTVVLPQSGPYGASKHAQLAFSRAIAAQLRPRGIRVHTVLPGFSPTAGFPEPSVLPKALEWTVIEPDRIARTIVASVTHDKRETFVPWWFRGMAVLQGSAPSTFSRGLTWFSRRFGRT
jgi:NAD(P)-dependent dehydrogenase (short-subunit alcohol dehydrogenase family)